MDKEDFALSYKHLNCKFIGRIFFYSMKRNSKILKIATTIIIFSPFIQLQNLCKQFKEGEYFSLLIHKKTNKKRLLHL